MNETEEDKTEFCTINMGRAMLDNDYTIYTDGSVKRLFDRNQWSLNHTQWTDVSKLDKKLKDQLLSKCDPQFKEELEAIFNKA